MEGQPSMSENLRVYAGIGGYCSGHAASFSTIWTAKFHRVAERIPANTRQYPQTALPRPNESDPLCARGGNNG